MTTHTLEIRDEITDCPVCGTANRHHFDIRDGHDMPARFIPCPLTEPREA